MAFKTGTCGAGLAASMALSLCLSAPPAQAGYVVTLTEQGSDVVATGSGPIDLTDLTLVDADAGFSVPDIWPVAAESSTGAEGAIDFYSGFSGPASFGSGRLLFATSASGDMVGFVGDVDELDVPEGYVSDTALSNTATYTGQTFSSLGVTPGTYEWKWGTGANQNFTLEIGVPEPSTWAMMLLGFAGFGFAGYRTRRARVDASAA
jgi:hypothetical protein